MTVGYARVSTDGQTLDAQQAALTAAGAESGVVTDRKALARAIAALGPGDVLMARSSQGNEGPLPALIVSDGRSPNRLK